MPMQFGPTMSRSCSTAICVICSCSFTPSSSPVSAKPEVNICTPNLLRDGIGDHPRRDLARHGAEHQIDLVRHFDEAPVIRHAERFDAGNLCGVDLHRVELARESAHVAQPHVAGTLV